MTQDRKTLEKEIEGRLRRNPADSRALFARISFEEELEAGIRESLAARRWMECLQ